MDVGKHITKRPHCGEEIVLGRYATIEKNYRVRLLLTHTCQLCFFILRRSWPRHLRAISQAHHRLHRPRKLSLPRLLRYLH